MKDGIVWVNIDQESSGIYMVLVHNNEKVYIGKIIVE